MLTKDGIHTLTNVVIADPTQPYFLPQFYTTQGLFASNTIQAKEKNYCN
jgi:hypothetical protein